MPGDNKKSTHHDPHQNTKRPALPKKWIVPIKLAVMAALAGCSAFVYFNVNDLQTTHMIILMPIVLVSAMAWMDCKMSERYWNDKDNTKAKESSDSNS